jgi:hypothetical protein
VTWWWVRVWGVQGGEVEMCNMVPRNALAKVRCVCCESEAGSTCMFR